MIDKECEFGTAIFENQNRVESDLPKTYPELQFLKLHQIHSDRVVPADERPEKADGHWTRETSKGLLIQTADCMPIIMLGPKMLLAVHAGWRGIEQNIIRSAGQVIEQNALSTKDFYVFIGPHIQKESFEVDDDVASRLMDSVPIGYEEVREQALLPHETKGKAFVDLDTIARAQLESSGFALEKTWISDLDTVADMSFHSYRREKTTGRQWSFGYLKP
ncbi:MAG: polyphenol oxidase family protein [Pseudomonadota bacterium]